MLGRISDIPRMETDGKSARSNHLIPGVLVFAMLALVTVMLLATALAVWLAELTGSLKFAALIVGGVCALAALAVYITAIRKPLEELREQAETIYEVARTAKKGYEWVTRKFELLLRLRDELFGN